MTKVTVRKIGGSLGVTIPVDVATRARIEEGTSLTLIEDGQGGLHLSRLDPEIARQVEIAEKIMDKYDSALRALAAY